MAVRQRFRNRPSMALLVAWTSLLLVTGCRFGNRVENAPDPDPLTGYYLTAAQSLKICTTAGSELCHQADPRDMPPEIGEIMSDPVVGLAVDDYQTGASRLVGLNSGSPPPTLDVYLNADSTLETYLSGLLLTPFDFATCDIRLVLDGQGSRIAGTFAAPADFSGTIKGKINMDFTLAYAFQNCTATELGLIKACYQAVGDCGGPSSNANIDRYQWITSLLDPFINTGSLNVADIDRIGKLAYTATYR